MSSGDKKIDKVFLGTVIFLIAVGLTIFISASMGVLARDEVQFISIISRQIFFGVILGSIACFIFSNIDYKFYKKYAFWILLLSILVTSLVFVPGIGTDLNTFATRWISVFGFTLQPVALLNIGVIIYWSAWLASVKDRVSTLKYGLVPLFIIIIICSLLLLKQPDTDSFVVICATCTAMYGIAGGKLRHIFFLIAVGLICLVLLAFNRPYIMSRIQTYIDPAENSQTTGFQIQQSLIAVGSGQIIGKGLGQSIQKYKFLPESISDTIFAVLAEEGGFVWCVLIIVVFLFFGFRGFRIAIRAPDNFGGLLVFGIVILTLLQSFTNIASVLGIIPFSGLPLAFFSQGGTAMLLVLVEIGIVLNVSRFERKI